MMRARALCLIGIAFAGVGLAAPNITTSTLPNGVVGTPYSATLQASGGPKPFLWLVDSGSLPAGLSLSLAGDITGKPTEAGTASFVVRVTAVDLSSDTKALQITVGPALAITTTSLPNGAVGAAYNQALTASGGAGGNTWSATTGALPAGLSLSPAGAITGTPTAAGTVNFTVQVTDSANTAATQPLSITIDPPPLTITTTSLPNGTVGAAYNQTLAASGGAGGNTWSVTTGALPAGLSLSPAGAITGTPTTAGASNFTVQVKDSANTTATQPLSLTIAPPPLTITTTSLPNGTVGAAYNQTLAASGGEGGNTWSVTTGALPAGLSLSPAGAITGTPTTAGAANFTVQVKDSANTTATEPLSITIAPPPLTITTTSLPNGTVGAAYNQTLAASGGAGGNTWSVTTGALPAGLSLSAAGAITGTPTTAGASNFTVQVKDSANTTTTQPLSITIAPPPLTITTTSLPNGTVGAAYNQTLAASGGAGGNTWSVTTGALPTGLSLSPAGAITGTPTAAGASNFTVQVKDSANTIATQPLSITIAPPPLTITTTSLPNGTVGAAYNQTLAASGGAGGNTWSVTTGALPAGLSLSPAGAITGTPTTAGTANFTVQVKDSANTTATQPLSITIALPVLTVTTMSLSNGTVGAAYNQTLAASGGAGGNTWSVTTGALPAGLSLSPAGAITGTPTTAGASNFTVQVKDSANTTATQPLSITIAPPVLTVTTTSLPNGTAGAAYNQTLAASGGAGGNTWSVTTGALPAGLSLSPAGAITGTPTAAGAANFTVQVKDSANTTATQPLSITIAPPALTITTTSLPNGTVGAAYNQTLAASGGAGGNTWSVTTGALPAGLSLSPAGAITGTPTTAGAANFTVQVKDSANTTATGPLSITIAPPALKIETTSLPAAAAGVAYSQSLSATGGAGTYTWSITSGALPQGLSLSPAGAISGTPTQAGSFTFTVSVSDGSTSASATLALAVTAPLSLGSTSFFDGAVGSVYSHTLTASGGTPPYTWAISGRLPPGLTLAAGTGVISGTPTAAGTYNFRATVTDKLSQSAVADLSLTIRNSLSITTASAIATGSAGSPYSQTFSADGGFPPYVWSVTGSVPAGLSFSNGTLSGKPIQVGAFPITVQVTDSTSAQASASYTLQVVSGLAITTPPALPVATVGVPYSVTLQPVGGATPYSWVVTAGSIPAGLTFSGGGQITGTPTSAGKFTFTVQVTDGNSNQTQKTFTLSVAGPLSITPPDLPPGAAGAAYSQTLTATGGTPPYVWSVTAGTLPSGLSLEAATGILAGTPGAAGTFTFTATVTDSNSVTAQKQFSINIGAGLTFTNQSPLPPGTAGSAYSLQLQASGGQPPYSWRVATGSLPATLSLNGATGMITGVPATAGTFNFTLQVSDSSNLQTSRDYTLVIDLPTLSGLSISGVSSTLTPLVQPLVDISLANPYPVPITGTLSLSFAPSGTNPVDDPSVQFSTGGRSAPFSIPAQTTHATFGAPQFGLQAGSVTGTITLKIVSLQAAGATLSIPDSATLTATIAAAAPLLRTLSVVHTQDGVQLQIVGLTNTRELTQASVTFQPASGTTLQNTVVTVPLSDVAKGWFQSAASAPFGGQFGLTLPFTFQGTVSLSSVSVVLTNSSGDSAPVSANY
jgi:hypothetical protein